MSAKNVFPHSNKKAGTVVLEFCKNCIANIKNYTATWQHLNCAPFPLRAWLSGQEEWRLAIWELNKRKTKHILNCTGVRNLVLSWPTELLYIKHIISHANVQHMKDLSQEVHKIWSLFNLSGVICMCIYIYPPPPKWSTCNSFITNLRIINYVFLSFASYKYSFI